MNTNTILQAALASTGITFIERGWLSANNIILQGGEGPRTLVDSGYCTHAEQTLALVSEALKGGELELLINTHLHSDHCGGNASLLTEYPNLSVYIPPGHAQAVEEWDTTALTFKATGQQCPRFKYHGVLSPGSSIQLGPLIWQIHGAKGHDPHSIIIFQPENRILITADALWENGFGVVFPELEGISAFDDVAETLDVIESLSPSIVIPGHGGLFTDTKSALLKARSRLNQFVQNPYKHQRYAIKVLLKYKLLEWQKISHKELVTWVQQTPFLNMFIPYQGKDLVTTQEWVDELLTELGESGALRKVNDEIFNT